MGGSTSGCEASDFAGFVPGRVALIQRGTCTFRDKALNAAAAGAAGVIIFNEGNDPDRVGLLFGTLGGVGVQIPVVGATFALGNASPRRGRRCDHVGDRRHLDVNTYNVLADHEDRAHRPARRRRWPPRFGAEGAGIKDNGQRHGNTCSRSR